MRADARLERIDAQTGAALHRTPPLVCDVEIAQRQGTHDEGDDQVSQQEVRVTGWEQVSNAALQAAGPALSEPERDLRNDQRHREQQAE